MAVSPGGGDSGGWRVCSEEEWLPILDSPTRKLTSHTSTARAFEPRLTLPTIPSAPVTNSHAGPSTRTVSYATVKCYSTVGDVIWSVEKQLHAACVFQHSLCHLELSAVPMRAMVVTVQYRS